MPPYHKYASKAQERKFFAMANRGEVSMAEAEGKAHATKGHRIPERVTTPSRPASKGHKGLAALRRVNR